MRFARGSALLGLALCGLLIIGCAPESGSRVPEPAPSEPVSPTTPTLSPEELRTQRAEEYVDSLPLRAQVGSITMSTIPGTDPAALEAFVNDHGSGGFLLMGGNIPGTPEELSAITSALRGADPELPRLVAIDEEGGEVTRLPWDDAPGANELRSLPALDTEAAFARRGRLLLDVGVNVNFGIVADLGNDPNAYIYWRTLGERPRDVSARVSSAVRAEHGLVASTLKHFPGHGASTGDSHSSIPRSDRVREEWLENDALPFAAGIESGAQILMFGHLAYPAIDPLPASLSPYWHDVARGELGFTGVAVTDDLGMLLGSGDPEYTDLSEISVRALASGNDLLLFVQGADPGTLSSVIDALAASVESGEIPRSRLREAAVRVAELRLQLGER